MSRFARLASHATENAEIGTVSTIIDKANELPLNKCIETRPSITKHVDSLQLWNEGGSIRPHKVSDSGKEIWYDSASKTFPASVLSEDDAKAEFHPRLEPLKSGRGDGDCEVRCTITYLPPATLSKSLEMIRDAGHSVEFVFNMERYRDLHITGSEFVESRFMDALGTSDEDPASNKSLIPLHRTDDGRFGRTWRSVVPVKWFKIDGDDGVWRRVTLPESSTDAQVINVFMELEVLTEAGDAWDGVSELGGRETSGSRGQDLDILGSSGGRSSSTRVMVARIQELGKIQEEDEGPSVSTT